MNRTRLAFFDVDGTLTTATTLFRFLRHYLAAEGHEPHEYDRRRQRLKAMTEIGVPRERTNLAYFENFAGAGAARVSALARDWFAAELRQGGLLNAYALDALRGHRDAGDRIVLVSGSFAACLAPLAEHIGAHDVWSTSPEIAHGRYTGRLGRPPMIGRAKADAVRLAAAAHRAAPEDCVAYGDHASDLPMLEATGSAAVVGGDPALRALARRRCWRLLPGAPAPAPLPLPRPDAGPSPNNPECASGVSLYVSQERPRTTAA
ncbi:HAD family hydrolase [Streptomyces formicae]